MVKSLKVHEKPAFKVGFKTLYTKGIPEAVAPLKAKATAQDRNLLDDFKKAAKGYGLIRIGWSKPVNLQIETAKGSGKFKPHVPLSTQVYALYAADGTLMDICKTRDEARRAKSRTAKHSATTIHKATVIRGDRVR